MNKEVRLTRSSSPGSPSEGLMRPPKTSKTQKALETSATPRAEREATGELVSPRSGARVRVVRNHGNSGGKKGRSGRLPKPLSDFLCALRTDPRFQRTLRRIAYNANSKNLSQLLKLLARYDTDAPGTRVAVDLAVSGVIVLPAMNVPTTPGPGETVIAWSDSASIDRPM